MEKTGGRKINGESMNCNLFGNNEMSLGADSEENINILLNLTKLS